MAFANPYNLSLFGGALALSVLTLNPLPALRGARARDALAPERPRQQRGSGTCSGTRGSPQARGAPRGGRSGGGALAALPEAERDRVEGLVARRSEIQPLAGAEPVLHRRPPPGELVKTDRLVDAFVDMALTCARYETYLAWVDPERSTATSTATRAEPRGGAGATRGRRSRRRTSRSS